ncbi:MAG: hypothetical protein HY774_25345 [Acidobacteria bacterium]|nr:hypothetical protein [Acidobacteriota bacterium]
MRIRNGSRPDGRWIKIRRVPELSPKPDRRTLPAPIRARAEWALIRWYAQSGKPPATIRRPSGRNPTFPQRRTIFPNNVATE